MNIENFDQYLKEKLYNYFKSQYCEVVNESYKHNVPKGSDKHFKVTVVSNEFKGQSRLERHKAVYACLSAELQEQIHALAIQCYTEEEWEQRTSNHDTPPCRGGFGE